MRKIIFAAVATLAIGGIGSPMLIANAQPAPPAPGMEASPPHQGRWMDWMHRGRDMHEHGPGRRAFSLVYRQEDRQLTPPDVQKIAEAYLLWNGNHSWKAAEVAAAPGGPIGFGLVTSNGTVIARFTMDPHSGRVTRTG